MYLVHAHLSGRGSLPPDTADLVMRCARPEHGVQHIVIHETERGPVVGLLLLAPSLERGERAAETVCRTALRTMPQFRRYALVSCRAALPAPFYERLLEE